MGNVPRNPWKVVFVSNTQRAVRDSGGLICTLTKPYRYTGQDERYEQELREREDNARLIAAAPEVLEALKLALPYLQDLQTENFEDVSAGIFIDPELTRCFESVKAAIAKATTPTPDGAK